jgi:hypothetical protein
MKMSFENRENAAFTALAVIFPEFLYSIFPYQPFLGVEIKTPLPLSSFTAGSLRTCRLYVAEQAERKIPMQTNNKDFMARPL